MSGHMLLISPLDRVLYLRSLPAFYELGSGQLAVIAQHARERFIAKGAFLVHRTEPADAFFVIIEGGVSLDRVGRPTVAIGPGDEVGFLDLLARTAHGMEVRAESDTLALELDWDAHLDVCEEHFPVLLQYMRYLTGLARRQFEQELSSDSRAQHRALASPPPSAAPLDLVQRINALHRSRAFSTCDLDAVSELARHCVEVRFSPDDVVWARGAPADHFLLLHRGTVEADTGHARGLIGGGPTVALGIHEALGAKTRWFDARAESALVALRIDTEPFLDVLEDHFDLAIDFVSLLARRVLDLSPTADGDPTQR